MGQHADGEGVEGTVWWCQGLRIGRESGKACEQFYTEEKTVTLPVQSQMLTKIGNPDKRGSVIY